MPGAKGYNPASEEDKEKARSMRQGGESIASIASSLGYSAGAVSGWCRGIEVKRPVAPKEAVKTPGLGKGIDRATDEARIDEDTRTMANTLRRAKLEDELEELAGRRHHRQRVEDLELREREAQLLPTPGAGQESQQLQVARAENIRLERELVEARHRESIDELRRGFQTQVDLIREDIRGRGVGRTELDLMSEALGKVENVLGMAGEKVDRFMRENKNEKQILQSLSWGISPDEYRLLLRGQEEILAFKEYCLSRHFASHRAGVEYQEPTQEEYQDFIHLAEQNNRNYQAISDRVQRSLAGGSKRGKSLATEPVEVKVEEKAEVKVEEKAEVVPAAPECYQGRGGHCGVSSLERTSQCKECAWV